MRKVRGTVQSGCRHFTTRMTDYPEVFEEATREKLYPGTLNVRLEHRQKVKVKEHFRIKGSDIGEPIQDLVFERCRLNGIPGYRIRPLNLENGSGGHGDHIIEVASAVHFKEALGIEDGDVVEIEFE